MEQFQLSLTIKDEPYVGPLDVLWDLVKNSKKDIYAISLVEIIDQYLAYVKEMQEMNLEVASEFIVMAAELHCMKSRMLLPYDENSGLEEREDGMKAKLVAMLLEREKFKMNAETLNELQNFNDYIIERNDRQRMLPLAEHEREENDAWRDVNLYDLVLAFSKLVHVVDETELAAMEMNEINVETAMEQIVSRLAEKTFFSFTELFGTQVTRRMLVVYLVAVLEMARSRIIQLKQQTYFDDIFIFRRNYDDGKGERERAAPANGNG